MASSEGAWQSDNVPSPMGEVRREAPTISEFAPTALEDGTQHQSIEDGRKSTSSKETQTDHDGPLFDTSAYDRKIRSLEKSLKEVSSENEKLREELSHSHYHNSTANRVILALERQVHAMKLELSEHSAPLRRELAGQKKRIKELLEEVKRRYDKGVQDVLQGHPQPSERLLLMQQVESWKAEAQRWKNEALCKGAEAISRCYQAAVDEAVRRERQKDQEGFRALRAEIGRLKERLRRV